MSELHPPSRGKAASISARGDKSVDEAVQRMSRKATSADQARREKRMSQIKRIGDMKQGGGRRSSEQGIRSAAGALSSGLVLKLPPKTNIEDREKLAQELLKQSAHKRTVKADQGVILGGNERHFEGVKITEPGIKVWRVVGRDVELLPDSEHGLFNDGDAYLVVTATVAEKKGVTTRLNQIEAHVHYWLGKNASIDKFALAAIRAVQLSAGMEPRPTKQHREVMGSESKRFVDAFEDLQDADDLKHDDDVTLVGRNKDVYYVEGGSPSMLNTVKEKKHVIRLYRFKGVKHVRVNLVKMHYSSLNEGDAFLLDAGSKLFVWYGRESNWQERSLCAQAAVQMKGAVKRAIPHVPVITMLQGQETPEFWVTLGVKESKVKGVVDQKAKDSLAKTIVKTAKEGGDDMETQTTVAYDLYEIDLSDDGKVQPSYIDQDVHGNIYMSKLRHDCVYVLDCGTEMFIYVGPSSNPIQREVAMKLALDSLEDDEADDEIESRPPWVTVKSMIHPYLHPMFTMKFSDWHLFVGVPLRYGPYSPDVVDRAINIKNALQTIQSLPASVALTSPKTVMDTLKAARKSDLFSPLSPSIAHAPIPAPIGTQHNKLIENDDDSDVDLAVYEIKGQVLARVKEDNYGNFHSDRCYAVLCVFEFKKTRRYSMFFWQGRLSPKSSYFVWHYDLMPALMERMAKVGYRCQPLVARVNQNAESAEFLSLFDPGIVILAPPGAMLHALAAGEEEKKAPSYHRSRRGSSVGFLGKMFHIRGATPTLTRTHQVPCRAKFLNSTDAFIIQASPSRFYIWYGTLCNAIERKRATRTAVHIYANLTDKEKEIGNPDDIFKTVKEGEETEEFWRALGGKEKYARFEEQETEAGNQRLANPKLFQTSLLLHHLRARPVVEYTPSDLHPTGVYLLDMHCLVFVWVGANAQQRLAEATKKLADEVAKDRKSAQVVVIHEGSEPAEFTQAFLGWHEVKRFIDPYAVREQRLRDIGVVGRIISQAEVDAEKEEMKKRMMAAQKKK